MAGQPDPADEADTSSDADPTPDPAPALKPDAAPAGDAVPSTNMRRSASTVLLGTLAGNGIAWLLNFVLARIFTNETFGAASIVIAVASIFIGVSTMRLEVVSLKVADDDEARLLLSAGLSLSVWWGVGLTVATALAVAFGAAAYWLGLGLMVTTGSLQLIGSSTLTRRRRYDRLTWANLQQAAGMSILQVGFGLLSAGVLSLLAGFAAARLVWLPKLKGLRVPLRPWRTLNKHYRRFATVAGSSAFINALSSQLSILLIGFFYTHADTGNYAMAVRVLSVPLAVLSQAVSAAAIGEIGALVRARAAWYPTVRRTAFTLLLIGAAICGAAFAFGAWLAPWFLGPKFDGTGEVIAVLAIGSWLQFAVAPFSQLLNITDSHRSLLLWDTTRLLLLSGSLIVPAMLGAPLLLSLLCYSIAMTVVYILLFLLIRRAGKNPPVPAGP